MSGHCKACDKVFTNIELHIGDELCPKCLYLTFGDSVHMALAYVDKLDDNEDKNYE